LPRYLIVIAIILQPCHAFAVPLASPPQLPQVEPAAIRVADIALRASSSAAGQARPGQTLQGQIVNDAGQGVAGVTVQLSNGQQQWQAKSDSEGEFLLTGLHGGTYQFQVAGQTQAVRAWAAGTAPPHASQGILVVPATDVIRGQRVLSPKTNQFFRFTKQKLANPWVVAGIVATAVAIPVAIHNADDDDPPASP